MFKKSSFIDLTGRMCEPLLEQQDAECNMDLSNVPANTVVKCSCTKESRRRFINGLKEMSIMCSSNGNWIESDVNCIRECHNIVFTGDKLCQKRSQSLQILVMFYR